MSSTHEPHQLHRNVGLFTSRSFFPEKLERSYSGWFWFHDNPRILALCWRQYVHAPSLFSRNSRSVMPCATQDVEISGVHHTGFGLSLVGRTNLFVLPAAVYFRHKTLFVSGPVFSCFNAPIHGVIEHACGGLNGLLPRDAGTRSTTERQITWQGTRLFSASNKVRPGPPELLPCNFSNALRRLSCIPNEESSTWS